MEQMEKVLRNMTESEPRQNTGLEARASAFIQSSLQPAGLDKWEASQEAVLIHSLTLLETGGQGPFLRLTLVSGVSYFLLMMEQESAHLHSLLHNSLPPCNCAKLKSDSWSWKNIQFSINDDEMRIKDAVKAAEMRNKDNFER